MLLPHARPMQAFASTIAAAALALTLALTLALPPAMATTHAADTPSLPELPDATPEKLPRWRGFNLLECFTLGGFKPFEEKDFRMIRELGFNFVRLPLDYRIWIRDGDWSRLDEERLKEIDKAVEYGRRHNIHVNINFHRAPGYSVNRNPVEKANIWTEPETQRICAMHWAAFARRYKGIPNRNLSFNLFNEPDQHVTEAQYLAVARLMCEAIRAEDPDRLIIADGLNWGNRPAPALAELRVAQATRGYVPFTVSHYMAPWVAGTDKLSIPTWPAQRVPAILHGPHRREAHAALALSGDFPADMLLRMHVIQVSSLADLRVRADGKEVFAHRMQPGDGAGEWKKAVYSEAYKIWQNEYDLNLSATIPAGTKQVQILVTEGDWLRMSEIGLRPRNARTDSPEHLLKLSPEVSFLPRPEWYNIAYNSKATALESPFIGGEMHDREWLWRTAVEPWVAFEKTQRRGVMVGEFGAFNKTPHPVVLQWVEDSLINWKRAGFGWALWNFRGSFGVLDSGRADVQYEDYQGHKLDRRLLEILQKY
ncbi:glycoside hydrolase [Verrucomicrobia bacterium LW23]|nr:glycoside hydrolase [Verrucomicrobia bacterium LW23]